MNPSLFLVGIGKVVFGIVVGAAGIFSALRVLGRMMKWGDADAEVRRGNTAAAVLVASALIAFGIVVQHAASATFNAMDLMYRGRDLAPPMIGRFALYGLVHVGVSLAVGACALGAGTRLFAVMTRGVDEIEEARKGNVAPALVLGAVLIVMALMAAPGLQTALDGLLPLPTLGRDEMVLPS